MSDIYDAGFDKNLNRDLLPEEGNPTVYNVISDTSIDVQKKITTTGGITSRRVEDNDGNAITIDWGSGNVHSVTLGGNRTIRFTNQADGQVLVLMLKQDSTGSRTVTWPSTVAWPSGTAPTLTTTGGKVDIITFARNNDENKEYGQSAGLNY